MLLTVGLYNIHGNKIIRLIINPFDLSKIIKHRVGKFNGFNSNFQYVNDSRILEELDYMEKIIKSDFFMEN
ncbi:kinase/pyrophosphorylase [Clostridium estertheticum]|nr:kinase/pyrophosphorylase [Clostridium estertheticum]